MRAAIYSRVSTGAQEERGTSLESQVADCRALAAELGADVVAEYQDVESGASWSLQGLTALLDAATRREYDVVLVYDPDRLSRDLAKQLLVRHDLEQAGVTIRYVTLRVEPTAEGRLLENVRAVIAEYERAKIAARMSRGRRHKASAGQIVGNGWAPYGYQFVRDAHGRVTGLEITEQAVIVRRIFAQARSLSSVRIADDLNADEVPAYRGGAWASSSVQGIITNPAYRGHARYGQRSSEEISIPCPAIVSDAEWDAVQDALSRRKSERPARRAGPDPFRMRGRLACAFCGRPLATVRIHAHRYYQCLGSDRRRADDAALCPLPRLPAGPLEERVERLLYEQLLSPAWLRRALRSAHALEERHQRESASTVRGLARQQERLRQQLRQTTERIATLPVGSERARMAEEHATTLERGIDDLARQIETAQATTTVDNRQETRLTFIAFAHALLERMADYSDRDLREIITALDLRGTVRHDPDGEPLGRRHRWVIAWSTAAGLVTGDRDNKKTRLRFYTPDYAEWDREHLSEPVSSSA